MPSGPAGISAPGTDPYGNDRLTGPVTELHAMDGPAAAARAAIGRFWKQLPLHAPAQRGDSVLLDRIFGDKLTEAFIGLIWLWTLIVLSFGIVIGIAIGTSV